MLSIAMHEDRDSRLLEAIELIGPVTLQALAFHPVEGRFESHDELVDRSRALADAGHLRRRTVVDVTGASVSEYEIDRTE